MDRILFVILINAYKLLEVYILFKQILINHLLGPNLFRRVIRKL